MYDGKTKGCSRCSFESCTSIGLEVHDKKCKEEIWTKCCKYCRDIFESSKELEIHQKKCKKIPNSEPAAKSSKGNTEMDWKICCKYCLDIFESAKGLEIHQKECKNLPILEPAVKSSKGIKGQLISKCSFGVFKLTKETTKFFVKISSLASKERSNQKRSLIK